MSQSFTNLLYHLIFSTKDRRPLITLEYQTRLYDYIRNTGGISLGIDGLEDHVHVLAKLRPDRANASGWTIYFRFSWQRGYASFTFSQ